jgi:hypothetical protein
VASPNIYTSGIGGTTGDELCAFSSLVSSGDVWYVQFTSGVDAASPAGKDRGKPLKTLSQAHTNAAAGDMIVFLGGHAETLTASQVISKAGLRLVSEGSGTSQARFTCGGAVVMLDVTGAGVTLGNLYFPASTVAPTPARTRVSGATSLLRNCYFECGSTDTVPALQYVTGATSATVRGTTFASTATATGVQPHSAINVLNAISDLTLDAVTLDGGVSGWSQPFALNCSAAVTRLAATNLDLLGDSDATVPTGSIYTIAIRARSGSARLVLVA